MKQNDKPMCERYIENLILEKFVTIQEKYITELGEILKTGNSYSIINREFLYKRDWNSTTRNPYNLDEAISHIQDRYISANTEYYNEINKVKHEKKYLTDKNIIEYILGKDNIIKSQEEEYSKLPEKLKEKNQYHHLYISYREKMWYIEAQDRYISQNNITGEKVDKYKEYKNNLIKEFNGFVKTIQDNDFPMILYRVKNEFSNYVNEQCKDHFHNIYLLMKTQLIDFENKYDNELHSIMISQWRLLSNIDMEGSYNYNLMTAIHNKISVTIKEDGTLLFDYKKKFEQPEFDEPKCKCKIIIPALTLIVVSIIFLISHLLLTKYL